MHKLGWVAVLVGVSSLAVVAAPSTSELPSPNVVLISIDTLRADHVSAYGYERDTTPGMRALAADGARFEHAYASSSTTGPTHATLFTGLYPVSHGLNKNGKSLTLQLGTLAEALASSGYQTAAVVSSFVLDGKFGFDRGFGTYLDEFDPASSKFEKRKWEGHAVPGAFDSRANATTDRAIAWLDKTRDPSRRFFLFVHYFDPHEPYRPPQPFASRFEKSADGESPVETAIRLYDGEIAWCDSEVARFLAALDAAVDPRQTLVILTADHGQGLMQHGDPHHSVFVYEEDVRVPLLVRWQGIVGAGTIHPGPVTLADVMPTVLDLANIPFEPGRFEGMSLRGALTGRQGTAPDRAVFMQRQLYAEQRVRQTDVRGEKFAVRVGNWKYIEGTEDGQRELFDLSRDPGETRNLVEQEPGRARALSTTIAEMRAGAKPHDGKDLGLDEADRQRLRALGYLE